MIGPLSSATTSGKSVPGSDGNEEVLHIPQSSSITGALQSGCLMSYPRHSWVGVCWSYSSAGVQSEYSTALADWARLILEKKLIFFSWNFLKNKTSSFMGWLAKNLLKSKDLLILFKSVNFKPKKYIFLLIYIYISSSVEIG